MLGRKIIFVKNVGPFSEFSIFLIKQHKIIFYNEDVFFELASSFTHKVTPKVGSSSLNLVNHLSTWSRLNSA